MALVDKKSKLDRNYRNVQAGGPKVGESLPQDGQYFTDKGVSNSPFIGKHEDHMISLLKSSIVHSTGDEAAATGLTYKSAPNAIAERDQDLNGSDPTSNTVGSPNYFNGYGKGGKHQGKKLGGLDLHEALLTNHYTYNHGDSQTTILNNKGKDGGIYDLDGGAVSKFDLGVPSQVHGNPLESPNYTQLVKKYKSRVHNISGPYPFSGVYGPVGSPTRFQDLDGKDYGGSGDFPGNRRYSHPETGTLYK